MTDNQNDAEETEKPERAVKSAIDENGVRRVVREVLSEAIVPKGYTRCAKCGDLVKDGKTCLCGAATPDAEIESDSSVSLLD